MSTENVVIAAIQRRCVADPDQNLRSTLAEIESAAAAGARIICLQELFNSLYLCQEEKHEHFQLAEPIPGPTTDELCRQAARLGVVIVAGMFERRAPGLYHNSAVVVDGDGSLVGHYRKMHIPDDPHYYEKFYFTPGDAARSTGFGMVAGDQVQPDGFQSFDTRFGRIGVCICWDQWFPEAARLTALTGAQLLVYPTAIGWLAEDKPDFGAGQLAAWTTMLRSHAIANGVYVVAPNRVGVEDNIEFWGNSLIIDPYGQLLQTGAADEAQTLTAEISWETIDTARTHWPFLRDRRVDAYQGLTRRWLDSP